MKKTIAILLVLVLAVAGLFAAYPSNLDSSNLKLTTTVDAVYAVNVSAAQLTGEDLSEKIASFVAVASGVTEKEISNSTTTLYINTVTNKYTQAKISVSAEGLKSTNSNISSTIGYTVSGLTVASPTPTSATVLGSDNANSFVLFQEASFLNGMRVNSAAFAIDVNTTDWLNASADADYEADWVITLATD